MSAVRTTQANPRMLTLASDPSNISKVEPYAEQIANQYQLDPEKRINLLISLTEAVTNAIIHGNQQDRSKMVKVQCACKQSSLAIRVSDQGRGFNYESLPDPTSPERILECGGRGVYLMHQLCDNLRFRNNGSTVEMHFRV